MRQGGRNASGRTPSPPGERLPARSRRDRFQPDTMPEFYETLSAPWRLRYVRSLAPAGNDEACFLCKYWSTPEHDRTNHVIWRGPACLVALNLFPYNNGHVLIAPGAHKGSLDAFTDAELTEMIRAVRDIQRLLTAVLHPHGYNVGMNVNRCAGAGLPDHLHAHVVPRWEGDTNFMCVTGNVRVIPQDMDTLYAELAAAAPKLGLPPLAGST